MGKIIKAFITVIVSLLLYNTGLWLLSVSLTIANIGGLFLLVCIPYLIYMMYKKSIINLVKEKEV